MSDHCRARIRAAIVAALTGLATTGARVYPGRVRPLGQGHAPTLLIYAVTERSNIDAIRSPAPLMRELTVAIDGLVSGVNPPDDMLDQIALEVEPAMVADPSFGGLTKSVILKSTRISARGEGETVLGEIHMEYEILYRTPENAPATTA